MPGDEAETDDVDAEPAAGGGDAEPAAGGGGAESTAGGGGAESTAGGGDAATAGDVETDAPATGDVETDAAATEPVGTDAPATGDDGFAVTRRKAVGGGLGLVVGAGVGVGATLATRGSDQIRKQRPNSDGKGTLGELRWILEEKHGLAVTSMVREDDTVEVAYESAASDRAASRREIGGVISAYGLIVANDGPTEKLSADIVRGFEAQATSYHVQAEWVQRWRSGDLSDSGVAQRVFNTRRFPRSASSE